MTKETKINLLIVAICAIVLAFNILFYMRLKIENTRLKAEAAEPPVVMYEDRILSDWEIFTMAVTEVESRYDSTAWNEQSGAVGYLQITKPYLDEYNRRHQDTIKLADCFSPDINLRVFQRMNEDLNPSLDFDEAIYLHNPNAGEWYRTKIYNAMDDILRREQARYKITQACNAN